VRYVVVGAGAVGGTVGGRLYDAGRDVVLVARGKHAAAMRDNGLRLALPDRVATINAPVLESVRETRLGGGDVVLLTTKTQDTLAALADVEMAAAGREVPIACVQNGVANERMALRRFANVYGVVVMLPAVMLEPGRIDAQGHPFSGLLDVGRVPAGTDATAARIAADFSASGFAAIDVPDILRWKYAKLLRNLGNAIEALCGHDVDDTDWSIINDIEARMRDEAIACFRAGGISWANDDEWTARRRDQVGWAPVEGRARAGGSTWQSLARGSGSVETDYLNGEISLIGRWYGVPTPVNSALQRIVARAVSEGRAPGTMTHTELLAAVDMKEPSP
jgi:2-dehydropantoate 2-reductase